MVDINLPNFITVGIIAILAVVAAKTVAKMAGKNSPV